MSKQRGFTLLEIMVALAIFGIVSGALIRNAGQAVRQTSLIQERTLAYWIAENELNELRSLPREDSTFPGIGSDRKAVRMANQDWEVVLDIEATENQDMRRVIVGVFTQNNPETPSVELTGFVGKY